MFRPHITLRLFLSAFFAYLLLGMMNLSAAEEAKILRDLAYRVNDVSEYEQARCKLDLYLPAKGSGFSTIVWFHGGGLKGGDKAGDYAPKMASRFTAEGIAVASVNYRFSPKVKFPAYVDDAAAAIDFVLREIGKHGGAPGRVFVSGHSAGGYLTAMIGVDERYLAKYGRKVTDIAGLMPISGQMITHSSVREERGIPRTESLIDAAAPTHHVSKNTPPILAIAGGNDLPGRAEENRNFISALKAAGHLNASYLEVEGRNHGTIANRLPEKKDVVAEAILSFIQKYQRP